MPLTTLPRKLLTLAFIVRERVAVDGAAAVLSTAGDSVAAAASSVNEAKEVSEVLLGEKKRGFGKGKWNGFGGKVDASDASIVAAAAREIQEEANVTVHERDLEHRGVLLFTFEGGKEVLEVHVYLTTKFTGEPSESDEMKPQWYDVASIPFSRMWADDHIWLPHVLAGKCVNGHFHFSSDEDTMLTHDLNVTEV
uniref:Nudix hydrolase domain-containing protein n=1 Tax=Globisporangium ultimum (strain ATCC 200006 / CBS 805.95 / DAOM BR144) TaxID=431595 RepID=K3WW38_GLOUD